MQSPKFVERSSLLCSALYVPMPPFLCSSFPEKSMVQQTALRYWSFHYVKRILETFFVHRCC